MSMRTALMEMANNQLDEAKEVLSNFMNDRKKEQIISLAKQKGLKVKDMGDKIEVSGPKGKVADMIAIHKPVYVRERAAWVPESILDDDVSHFMGAAAAAKKAGKSHFNFGGKKYKVTMKSDAAKKIGESAECPTCRDGECQCEQPVQEAKISELSSKTLSSYIKKSAADAGSKAWDAGRGEHDKLGKSLGRLRGIEKATDKLAKKAKKNRSSKEESVEEATKATAQHKPTAETSDTWDKQLATRKGEKDFIDQHTMDVALDAEKIYQQNKYEALSQTPARRGDQKVGDKNPVNPVKANPIEGMRKVLAGIRAKG